jgi:HSP20 family protein
MVMSRWDPYSEAMSLRDAMNRLFEQAVWQPSAGDGGQRSAGAGFAPAIDVCESADDFIVEVSLPGVKPEDVDIEIEQGVLTIKGEMREDAHRAQHPGQQGDRHEGNFHMRERRWGRFFRSITLPTMVNADRAQATFENGILTLRIPKAEETRPRRIQIHAGGQGQATGQLQGAATSRGSSNGG